MKNSEQKLGDINIALTIGRGTIFGVFAKLVHLCSRLIMVPFVIQYLGLEGYGTWGVIIAITAYIRFGVIGAKSAFQKYVADSTGTGDFEKASILLSTGTTIMLALSLMGVIFLSIFARLLAEKIGFPNKLIDPAATSIMILGAALCVSNIGSVFEAIIMGAHRIEIIKKLTMLLVVLEAVAIIFLLMTGYGLVAMALVIAISEVSRIAICYVISARVLPYVHVSRKYISRKALPSLFSYAGSYQLLSLLGILYNSVLPIAVMSFFGAQVAGIFALSSRLIEVALIIPEAFLPSLLSGGAMVSSSGSTERFKSLVAKSFKFNIISAVPTLAFVAVFGKTIIFAWTGQASEFLGVALWFICLSGFFRSIARLCLIIYRAVGGGSKDVIWQMLRILVLLAFVFLSTDSLGYEGAMLGVLLAELSGMFFIITALPHKMLNLTIKSLIKDFLRILAYSSLSLSVCLFFTKIVGFPQLFERKISTYYLSAVSILFPALFFLTLYCTQYITVEDRQKLREIISSINKKSS